MTGTVAEHRVLCDIKRLPGARRILSLLACLILLWLAVGQIAHSFCGVAVPGAALCDSRACALGVAAIELVAVGLVAVVWSERTRVLWDPATQYLIIERSGLAQIARWRISTGEISLMRVKRRPRRMRAAWDIGYRDFAGGSMRIVRTYAQDDAIRIGESIAAAIGRPVTVTES